MGPIALYGRYAALSVKSQLQYPAAFLIFSLAQLLATGGEILAVWVLFHRFGQVVGWRLGEVAVFYGVVNISFAFADAMTRGFDVFGPEFVRTGAFDRLLLRPRATALQLLGHELRLSRVGRLIQGVIVLGLGAAATHIAWTFGAGLLLAFAITGGLALFSGLLILQATLAFWTVESLEVANIVTYGGVEAAQYPLGVYAAWFRDVLIFIVPLGCVAYFPVVALLGRHDPLGAPDWILPAAPAVGFVFLLASLWLWGFGLRRYASTGS